MKGNTARCYNIWKFNAEIFINVHSIRVIMVDDSEKKITDNPEKQVFAKQKSKKVTSGSKIPHDELPVGRMGRGVSQGEMPVGRMERGVSQGEMPVGRMERGVSQGEMPVGRMERGVSQGEMPVGRMERGVSQGEMPVGRMESTIKPHVLAHPVKEIATGKLSGSAKVATGKVGFDFPATLRGSTTHFNVYYNPSLGTDGQTIADAVLASCEYEYNTTFCLFWWPCTFKL